MSYRVPSYRRHRPTGQAVVTLTDPAGKRRDYYLGAYGSKESKAEYARLLAEWNAAGRCIPRSGPAPGDLTVNELVLQFWRHAEGYYRHADGSETSELDEYRYSLRPLKTLYGHTLGRDFGPLALKAVRQSMLESGLSRRVINSRIGRVRRVFKWAVSEELIPPSVFHGLQTVTGLGKGRTTAPDPGPVEPVADELIERTLPKLSRHVAGMVRFQRLTGCRPQDVCNLRRCDIDTTQAVWFYRPPQHKNAWRNQTRCIAIGPKAQAVLAEFPTNSPSDYVFSPAVATIERYKIMREARVTRVQPSQICRAKRKAKRRPGAKYSRVTYHRAIYAACERHGILHWHPNQLRHSRGTEVRKQFGLEEAQVILGHANAKVTEVYAMSNAELAAKVAMASG